MNINNFINQANITMNNSKTKDVQSKLSKAKSSKNDKELMDACKEFEAVFMNQVLKEMRSTVVDGGLTEKSRGREIFEDMYYEELSKKVSYDGEGIGLAKMLYNQMKRNL